MFYSSRGLGVCCDGAKKKRRVVVVVSSCSRFFSRSTLVAALLSGAFLPLFRVSFFSRHLPNIRCTDEGLSRQMVEI